MKKRAGLLKVPQQLLESATDWMISAYCNSLINRIETVLEEHKQSKRKIRYLESNLKDFFKPFIDILDKLRYDIDPQDEDTRRKALDELIELIHPFSLQIPAPHMIDGTPAIKENDYCITFAIEKEQNGYTLGLDLNLDYNEQKVQAHELLTAGTVNQAVQFLYKYFSDIQTVYSEYREFVLGDFPQYDPSYIKNLQELYTHIKQIASKYNDYAHGHFLEFELKDIPYQLKSELPFTVFGCKIQFISDPNKAAELSADKNNKPNWRGLWVENPHKGPFIGTLYLNDIFESMPSNLKGFQYSVNNLKITIRHELQHLMQDTIKLIKNLKEEAGLPPHKTRHKSYNPSGIKRKKLPNSELELDTEDPYKRVRHELRDVEFYTRLNDSIDEFNLRKNKFPKELYPILAKQWVGGNINYYDIFNQISDIIRDNEYKKRGISNYESIPHEMVIEIDKSIQYLLSEARYEMTYNKGGDLFFQNLKQHQPLKYQKAVKEFYKTVL